MSQKSRAESMYVPLFGIFGKISKIVSRFLVRDSNPYREFVTPAASIAIGIACPEYNFNVI